MDIDYPCPVCNGTGEIDLDKIVGVKFDGIDHRDAPDYCDAYITSCEYDGKEANEDFLEEINDDKDIVYELLMEYLH
jgi:hypothetical protein